MGIATPACALVRNDWITKRRDSVQAIFEAIGSADPAFLNIYTAFARYLVPILAGILLLRCVLPMLMFRREPEIWGWLMLPDGRRLPLTHWENVIGRSKRSDVVIDLATVSRTHAVLTRYDDGSWTVADADSVSGTFVNGEKIRISALDLEDIITIGGLEMKLLPISRKQEIKLAKLRTKAGRPFASIANVLLLTALQCLICLGYLLGGDGAHSGTVVIGFLGLIACQWALLSFYLFIRKPAFELESIAFFLCTMGMAAIAAVRPGEAVKQLIALVMGLGVYLAVGWSLRDLERAKVVRRLAAWQASVFW